MAESEYAEFVKAQIARGDDPNDILSGIEAALATVPDWALWGDGEYRSDTCCSVCGSYVAGVCPHKDDPTREIILASEYRRRVNG